VIFSVFSFHSKSFIVSFAGLGFLSFYLAGKMHLFDSRGHAVRASYLDGNLEPQAQYNSFAGKSLACTIAFHGRCPRRHFTYHGLPPCVSPPTCSTCAHPVSDHWQDVLVGSLVGTILSYFSYRQYYPSLASPVSHRPYSPRIKREDDHSILPMHHHQQKPSVSEASPLHRPSHSNNSSIHSGHEENYELAGTVPRPGPEHLEDAWKERSAHAGVPLATVPNETVRSPEASGSPRGENGNTYSLK